MPAHFRLSSLIPSGLVVESVMQADDMLVVTARAGIQVAMCPLCRSPSRRVHSRYVRQVSDLPCSGRSVCLRVVTRRFCCETPHCRRRIFAERFDEAALLVRSVALSKVKRFMAQTGSPDGCQGRNSDTIRAQSAILNTSAEPSPSRLLKKWDKRASDTYIKLSTRQIEALAEHRNTGRGR